MGANTWHRGYLWFLNTKLKKSFFLMTLMNANFKNKKKEVLSDVLYNCFKIWKYP